MRYRLSLITIVSQFTILNCLNISPLISSSRGNFVLLYCADNSGKLRHFESHWADTILHWIDIFDCANCNCMLKMKASFPYKFRFYFLSFPNNSSNFNSILNWPYSQIHSIFLFISLKFFYVCFIAIFARIIPLPPYALFAFNWRRYEQFIQI